MIFFVLILGLRLQRYSTNTKRYPPSKVFEAISTLNTSTSQNSRQADAAAVSAVSVKLPEFWPEDPEAWFIRVEAQLRSPSVTQGQTKFDYVVASLDNSTAAEVKAVLLHLQPLISMSIGGQVNAKR